MRERERERETHIYIYIYIYIYIHMFAPAQELKARLAQSAEQWSESLKVERSTRETSIASLVAQERLKIVPILCDYYC